MCRQHAQRGLQSALMIRSAWSADSAWHAAQRMQHDLHSALHNTACLGHRTTSNMPGNECNISTQHISAAQQVRALL